MVIAQPERDGLTLVDVIKGVKKKIMKLALP